MSGILLNTLKEGLDPHLLSNLENDSNLREASEKYLSDLLINDDLLSTDTFTTTSNSQSTTSNPKGKTLIEEIAELDYQQRQINLELASITNDNRDLIIDISEDVNSINHQIDTKLTTEIEHMLKTLKVNVDPSTDSSKPFAESFHVSINDRLTKSIKVNNSILSNIDSVLDILEIPTLCKLCILQGNYQESLGISMLSQTLVIRFPKLTAFQKIHEQVDRELQLMVRGLIKLLNTNLKQNNILKIFQILNKPDLINHDSLKLPNSTSDVSDYQQNEKPTHKTRFLKMIYLNARFKFITNELENLEPIKKFNKLTYLKRFIEVYREHIFSSLSIYHANFSSKSMVSKSYSSEEDDSILLGQFTKSLADLLCKELKRYLPEIIENLSSDDNDQIDFSSQKDGVILQVLYLCRSLSRYSLDFENIMVSNLCYSETNPIVTEKDWMRNLSKVKKFRFD